MARQHEQTWSDILWACFFFLPPADLELQDDTDAEIYIEKILLDVTNEMLPWCVVFFLFFFSNLG